MRNLASRAGNATATAPSVPSDKPAVKIAGRHPLLIGLVIIAAAWAGYLGWRYFAHSPAAGKPEAFPPVPVIATTVQQRDFPIVLTGIGNVTALNSATVRSMVTEVRDNGLALPLDAVQQGPQGQYVFVVGPDHKVAI